MDAPFLGLNGVIYFNENVKADRKSAARRMIELLQQGGNLMYFPEGTWNLHPCLPMLACYWGIVDVARQGGAVIVPIAADQYGKHFKVNIGKNFDVAAYPATVEGKSAAITDLRDTLAALKWEIWETEPVSRAQLSGTEWDEYVAARFEEWPYFNMEYIHGLIYRPKGVTEPEEAFAFMDKLTPSLKNAFYLGTSNYKYSMRIAHGYMGSRPMCPCAL